MAEPYPSGGGAPYLPGRARHILPVGTKSKSLHGVATAAFRAMHSSGAVRSPAVRGGGRSGPRSCARLLPAASDSCALRCPPCRMLHNLTASRKTRTGRPERSARRPLQPGLGFRAWGFRSGVHNAGWPQVATVAFGMGIDNPGVRLVVHWDLPMSVTGFSQARYAVHPNPIQTPSKPRPNPIQTPSKPHPNPRPASKPHGADPATRSDRSILHRTTCDRTALAGHATNTPWF